MNMTQKNKNQAVSIARYTWNRTTFAREFQAELDAPPTEVAALIEAVDGDYFVSGPNRYTQLTQVQHDNGAYDFNIRLVRDKSPQFLSYVNAHGRILYSEGYQKTLFRGEIRMSTMAMLVAIFSFFAGIAGVIGSAMDPDGGLGIALLLVLPIMLVAAALIAFTYHRGYQRVQASIETVLREATQYNTTTNGEDTDYLYADEAQSQRTTD